MEGKKTGVSGGPVLTRSGGHNGHYWAHLREAIPYFEKSDQRFGPPKFGGRIFLVTLFRLLRDGIDHFQVLDEDLKSCENSLKTGPISGFQPNGQHFELFMMVVNDEVH